MSRNEALLHLFKAHGNRLTLGQMLSYGTLIGSKYSSRISDLRKMGYNIHCEEHKEQPTANVYTLIEIKTENGQRMFA